MKLKDRLLPLVTVALVFAAWYIAAAIYGIELILPKPDAAFRELWAALGESVFWKGVGNTMLRSVLSFAIAFAAALVFALASVGSRIFYKLFYPLVVLLRALPTISVIFICYIAVRGWYRAVLISFLVIFPTLYSAFYNSITRCGGSLSEVGKVYKVRKGRVLTKYVIPTVWAETYTDIVNTLSLTVKLIIAAEAVTATGVSLGGLMAESKAMVEMGRIFAYTLVAIGLSYLTELVVRLTSRMVKEISEKWRFH